jgi:carbonic anhydrase
MPPGQAREPAARPAAAATGESALPPGTDPLEHLRGRLAEKLGGQVKPRARRSEAPVVKLVNKAEPDDASADPPSRLARAPAAARSLQGETLAILGSSPAHAARLAAIQREASALARPVAEPTRHWAYQGEGGPESWGRLHPDFATCANGQRQSPIDIRDGLKLELDPVLFDYRESAVRVIDTGHTVQVNVAGGNHIEVMGRRYELQQFHFHRPSEERIDGRSFDMVVHLVHRDADGRLAVVAVLLQRGAAQPLIQTVWNNLPLERGAEQPVRAPLDLGLLLPAERAYHVYMGSLTTPPCTEGVLWVVMKTPVGVSQDQIEIFGRLYPMNARPVQAASDRLIKESR